MTEERITWKDRLWYICPFFNIVMMMANGEARNNKVFAVLMVYNVGLAVAAFLITSLRGA